MKTEVIKINEFLDGTWRQNRKSNQPKYCSYSIIPFPAGFFDMEPMVAKAYIGIVTLGVVAILGSRKSNRLTEEGDARAAEKIDVFLKTSLMVGGVLMFWWFISNNPLVF